MAVNGQKLRLALVINELIPYKGGLQRFTFNFLTDLLTEDRCLSIDLQIRV